MLLLLETKPEARLVLAAMHQSNAGICEQIARLKNLCDSGYLSEHTGLFFKEMISGYEVQEDKVGRIIDQLERKLQYWSDD